MTSYALTPEKKYEEAQRVQREIIAALRGQLELAAREEQTLDGIEEIKLHLSLAQVQLSSVATALRQVESERQFLAREGLRRAARYEVEPLGMEGAL